MTEETTLDRRKTRTVDVGGIKIGSGYPVSVQSMSKTDTVDVKATVEEIRRLSAAGCEIVRVAVKTTGAAAAIADIKKETDLPLVADIHFDHKLAIDAIRAGADKVRINPGNIKGDRAAAEVITAARGKGIPIRLGINSGSLMEMASSRGAPANIMVSSTLEYLEMFRARKFEDIVISLKSSDVRVTIAAYRKMAAECDYPFHVGVTAAGPPSDSIVKSSIGIGSLLVDGIGDTIRVSFTGDPVAEVDAARKILSSCGVRCFGPEIISCPTCGRCQVDLVSVVRELKAELDGSPPAGMETAAGRLLVAVMGCEVNGPGEAGVADIGIAFGKDKGALFKKGEIIKTVDVKDAVKELIRMIREKDEG